MKAKARPRPGLGAQALATEVEVRSRGLHMHWVVVDDLAPTLGLDGEVLQAAIDHAIHKGWLIGEGNPTQRVCIASSFSKMSELS
jgi:hypothetical protein